MVRGTAAQMRPAWAASWRPWCRLPSIASTGPTAASWNSAATSRRSPPPSGPGWGASGLPLHLPQVISPPNTILLLTHAQFWVCRSAPGAPGTWRPRTSIGLRSSRPRMGAEWIWAGWVPAEILSLTSRSSRPAPSVRPARRADLASSLSAVSPQIVHEPTLHLGHDVTL